MYQQTTLIGYLGNDPELRYTPNGIPVTDFRMAVSKNRTTESGERQTKTTWFRVTVWRQQAETCSKYLQKGRQVMVIGEMEEAQAWQDRDGNLRAGLEITANQVRFLGGGSGQSSSNGVAQIGSTTAMAA